uniref:RING-type domain-containing protein n=1 Tax=Meloidogyne enterolobii TaxID=390850 RepID=A0A6V7Y1J9_MELEN|nr:unnamed protein product [Meloidogyne enterolobii]
MVGKKRTATDSNYQPQTRRRIDSPVANNNNQHQQQQTGIPVANNNNQPQQQQNVIPPDVLAQIMEKRRQRSCSNKPENFSLVPQLDNVTRCTSTNLLLLDWKKDHVFDELIGFVVFCKRAPTPRNLWDRCDVIIQLGREGETERLNVFSWKKNAERLEGATLNSLVSIKNLMVVPESPNRSEWSGTIEYKLKFVNGSTLKILQQQNNQIQPFLNNQQRGIGIDPTPSSLQQQQQPCTSAEALRYGGPPPLRGQFTDDEDDDEDNLTQLVPCDATAQVEFNQMFNTQETFSCGDRINEQNSNSQTFVSQAPGSSNACGENTETQTHNSTIGRTSPATQNDVFDSNWERSFGFHPPGGLTLCERNSLLISRVKLPSTYNPEEDQETCPICIEGFLPGQSVIFLPCCHKIHKACFWKLSKDYRCCSICKMDMSKGIYYRN